jgi:glycosyltransferase involved in cell wall biosynthesis
MRFTVILNTFNRAHFLPRVLTAWTRLEPHSFDMVVADDGSDDGTAELLRELGPRLPYRLIHVRHEKVGHRRAEILNKAVHLAREEALLFTDADSLPKADLLAVHGRHFAENRLLVGGYLRLDEESTSGLDLDGVRRGDYERAATKEVCRRLQRQHCKHRLYIWLRKKGRPHVMGLNMVVPRAGFERVNGYDNNFRGWGRADGDLRERLKCVGVRPYSDWNKAVVFHLHHPEDPTKAKKQNVSYAERPTVPTVAEAGFAEVRDRALDAVIYRND